MTFPARLRSWLSATFRRSRMEREMEMEIQLHIAHHAEQLIRAGVPPQEAQRRAALEFGNLAQVKDACRDARHATLAESLVRDLRHGLRMLRKNPGFAALAIVTLGLGMAACTAVFSLVNTVLLRALPYRDPDRLVFIYETIPRISGVPLEAWGAFNGDFYEWQKQSRSWSHLALFTTNRLNLSGIGAATRVGGSRITGEFFPLLGIAPELGRAIEPADDQPGKGQVAVISHALWQSRFGADLGVLGRELLLNAKSYRIVGVMPAGFSFPHGTENIDAPRSTDVWVPLAMSPEQRASWDDDAGNAIGRLRPGVPLGQAQAEMRAITARLDRLHPAPLQGCIAVLRPFDVTVTGGSRRALLIFMGSVFWVLLIACSNVASLVLARANRRTLEIGVRTALGASRARLVRQLVAESLCVAAAAGVLGLAAAFAAIRLLTRLQAGNIPRLDETSIDWRVWLFTAAAALGTTLLFGFLPALSISRCNLNEVLKGAGSRTVKGGSSRLHRGLTIAEVALTFVLLAGAGLLIRSFVRLQTIDKGFVASSTVTMSVQLDDRYDQPQRQNAFFRGLLDRTRPLPGVQAAALISNLPLGGGESVSMLVVEGHPPDEKTLFEGRAITPQYFAAMGIPLLAGRDFTTADTLGQAPVAIVSRSFAKRYFPGQDAVGKRFHFLDSGPKPTWWTIVGVAGDVRQWEMEKTPLMQTYLPFWQTGGNAASLVARTSLPPDRLAASLGNVLRGLDPAVALSDVSSMSDVVSAASAARRFQTLLGTAFGGIALLLSLVGLYALMTYSVQQRTAEIGIRMALGAQRGGVLRLMLKQGATLALEGIALGILSAWIVTRWMASLLFQVDPTDAPTFLGVAVLFAAVALTACYIPARRATQVDPMVALRYE